MDGSSTVNANAAALFQLDKKLRSSWTSWSIAHSITEATIDSITLGFSQLDKLVKIRFMIALLGMDANKRTACAPAVRKLLAIARESNEEWIPIIGAIVSERIFTADNLSDGDSTATSLVREAANKVVQNIISLSTDGSRVSDSNSSELKDMFYFTPFERKYLMQKADDGGGITECSNFQYSGKPPDFLARHKLSLQSSNGQKDFIRATPSLFSVSNRPSVSQASARHPSNASLSSTNNRAIGLTGNSSLRPSKIESERKALVVIPISQIKEMEESRGDNQSSKKKRIGGFDDSADSSETKKLKSVESEIIAKSTAVSSVTADVAAVVPPSHSQPLSTGPDLTILFQESNLLTESDKEAISLFFGDNWRNYYSDPEKELKFKLKEEQKVLPNGTVVTETIFLKLQCNNHSWSKTKKSSKSVEPSGNGDIRK